MKTNLFSEIMAMQTKLYFIPCSFFLSEASYEMAENELFRNVIFSLKCRYRPPNDFLIFLLQSVLLTHV